MSSIEIRRPAVAPALLLLATLALSLAACGKSSSSRPTSSGRAAASSSRATAGANGAPASASAHAGEPAASQSSTRGGAGVKALRGCLAKDGIELPRRKPGQPAPGGGIFRGNGSRLPPGVSRAQFEAALKKCGAPASAARRGHLLTPAYRGALASFARCMRLHGVELPAPNTAGSGPIFRASAADRANPTFRAALGACRSLLRGASTG